MIRQLGHPCRVLVTTSAATLLTLFFGVTGPPAFAATTPMGWAHGSQTAELTATGGAAGDYVGYSVALDQAGTVAVVGAPDPVTGPGAAYVFDKAGSTWQQVATLSPSDTDPIDQFGGSVAISPDGSTIAVGADLDDNQVGAVYIFKGSGSSWATAAELSPSGGTQDDAFGDAVALSADGSELLAGAPEAAGSDGAAYVFEDSAGSWQQTAELKAHGGIAGGYFGHAVALTTNGQTAVVGGLREAAGSGAAYVFSDAGGTWEQTAQLAPSDPIDRGAFGDAVSVTADASAIAVGAQFGDGGIGAVYLFTPSHGAWRQKSELTASDATQSDAFGSSVGFATQGSTLAVGSMFGGSDGQGSAYVFTSGRHGWRQRTELAPSDGADGDSFGLHLAITPSGSTLLVGAYGHASQEGAAYVFER